MELYLAHHGIKGQKWGVRRQKRIALRRAKREKRQKRKANIQKLMKGARIVAGVALVAYGGYKVSKFIKSPQFQHAQNIGKDVLETMDVVQSAALTVASKTDDISKSIQAIKSSSAPSIPKTATSVSKVPSSPVLNTNYNAQIVSNQKQIEDLLQKTQAVPMDFGDIEQYTADLLKRANQFG